MGFEKEYLDIIFGPLAFIAMVSYCLKFLHEYRKRPLATALGRENRDKKNWAEAIMRAQPRDVISAEKSDAKSLISHSLGVLVLVGALSSNNSVIFRSVLSYGDTHAVAMAIKYSSLLVCLLLAIIFSKKSIRQLTLTNYTITMPESDGSTEKVVSSVIRGGNFLFLARRSFRFGLVMLAWFFGPVPFFLAALVMVGMLYREDMGRVAEREPEKPPEIISHIR